MIDDHDETGEWQGSIHLSIEAVYALRSALQYAYKMWPGAPARPYEEQEFLTTMIELTNRLALEHSFISLEQERDNDGTSGKEG